MAATQKHGVLHPIAHFRAAYTILLYHTLIFYATCSQWSSRLHYTHNSQMFPMSAFQWVTHNVMQYILSYRDAKQWGCNNLELFFFLCIRCIISIVDFSCICVKKKKKNNLGSFCYCWRTWSSGESRFILSLYQLSLFWPFKSL